MKQEQNIESEIQKLINKYNPFFENTSADVATSVKGEHLFYFTDSKNNEKFSLRNFETADELEQIILYENADEMTMALEAVIENLNSTLHTKNISYSQFSLDYGEAVIHLANLLDQIQKELNRWYPKFNSSYKCFQTYYQNLGNTKTDH